MTSVQQILSFTLGSLLAQLGSQSHSSQATAYERELDRLLKRMRRRTARSEALCLLTEEKSLVGLNQPAPATHLPLTWFSAKQAA